MNRIFALFITLQHNVFFFQFSLVTNDKVMGQLFSGYKDPNVMHSLEDISTGLENAVVPDRLSQACLQEKPRKRKRLGSGSEKT